MNTAKLKAAALAATPGPWTHDGCGGVCAEVGLNKGYFVAECESGDWDGNSVFIAAANPAAVLELIAQTEALVAAHVNLKLLADVYRQAYEEARAHGAELEKRIAELEQVKAAAEKLVRCKGRYHSEQNYRALAALFGVKTPDLPPLEHENVHYADAAEMEIAALRQRIAELEARKITLKLPRYSFFDFREGSPYQSGAYCNLEALVNECHKAGINLETGGE
ncbi:ead/Ea22-like family protein [Cronobacter sakazakii]|uniref:ead/Ea22-like family protein n=1 Tax=Cronobacter sakazakii TaxID=28141 RepID=UPI001AE437F9